jgi:hypothetical protein
VADDVYRDPTGGQELAVDRLRAHIRQAEAQLRSLKPALLPDDELRRLQRARRRLKRGALSPPRTMQLRLLEEYAELLDHLLARLPGLVKAYSRPSNVIPEPHTLLPGDPSRLRLYTRRELARSEALRDHATVLESILGRMDLQAEIYGVEDPPFWREVQVLLGPAAATRRAVCAKLRCRATPVALAWHWRPLPVGDRLHIEETTMRLATSVARGVPELRLQPRSLWRLLRGGTLPTGDRRFDARFLLVARTAAATVVVDPPLRAALLRLAHVGPTPMVEVSDCTAEISWRCRDLGHVQLARAIQVLEQLRNARVPVADRG